VTNGLVAEPTARMSPATTADLSREGRVGRLKKDRG